MYEEGSGGAEGVGGAGIAGGAGYEDGAVGVGDSGVTIEVSGWRDLVRPGFIQQRWQVLVARWYGVVWYGMVWFSMVHYGMVWYSLIGMVQYGMVGMVWYGQVARLTSCSHDTCTLPGLQASRPTGCHKVVFQQILKVHLKRINYIWGTDFGP